MKTNQSSIVILGHDEHLNATRQWVLQTRGYRVLVIEDASAIGLLPQNPAIQLLILCHSVPKPECETALALATTRWPEVRSLMMVADRSRAPSGILGQLLHTMEGPAKLISMVSDIVNRDTSAAA